MRTTHINVLVGVPSNGMWHADFALSLIGMIQTFGRQKLPFATTQGLMIHHVKGSILPKQRLECITAAQKHKCSHVLFIDTDHTFPPSLLHRLLRMRKEVAACNCVTKTLPAIPTARQSGGEHGYGVPVHSIDSHGLERVWRIGTGVMLVETSVFERTGPDIFSMYYRPEVESYQGEDWTMCEAFDRVGAEIWIDHDLSREVGHIGYFNYRHDFDGEVVHHD